MSRTWRAGTWTNGSARSRSRSTRKFWTRWMWATTSPSYWKAKPLNWPNASQTSTRICTSVSRYPAWSAIRPGIVRPRNNLARVTKKRGLTNEQKYQADDYPVRFHYAASRYDTVRGRRCYLGCKIGRAHV